MDSPFFSPPASLIKSRLMLPTSSSSTRQPCRSYQICIPQGQSVLPFPIDNISIQERGSDDLAYALARLARNPFSGDISSSPQKAGVDRRVSVTLGSSRKDHFTWTQHTVLLLPTMPMPRSSSIVLAMALCTYSLGR